jgi:nicotinamide-nucleotide amidase
MTAQQILELLIKQGKKLVIAESITGGALSAEFAAVAGASQVLLASVVAYDTDLKHEMLGVSKQLLANQGPVDPEVVAQMALGLRAKIAHSKSLSETELVALATTGVAGPDTQGGKPVGTLYIAVASGDGSQTNVFAHTLSGNRAEIQNSAVLLGLEHLWEEIQS